MMVGLYQAYQRGQTHFQVGDNNNLFDYTYVGNLAQAHLLAADRLVDPTTPDSASIESAPTYATLVGARSPDGGGEKEGATDTMGDSEGVWDGVGIFGGDTDGADGQGGWIHAVSGGV